MTRRYCLTLDLKDDPQLIREYKKYHERIWPEISSSLKESGIEDAEIYLLGTRMFMILEVNDSFSFEAKGRADMANPKVREWEELMRWAKVLTNPGQYPAFRGVDGTDRRVQFRRHGSGGPAVHAVLHENGPGFGSELRLQ